MILSSPTSPIRQPIVILFALGLIIKVAFLSWMSDYLPLNVGTQEQIFTEIDYPSHWDIDLGHPIAMPFENTLHYSLDTYEGFLEWEATTPGKGLVYLGAERKPFSISMFHQLRCLGVIRKRLIPVSRFTGELPPTDDILHHCLNYIRQMVLCRADVSLEQTYTFPTAVIDNIQMCNNWENVYQEVKKNQEAKYY